MSATSPDGTSFDDTELTVVLVKAGRTKIRYPAALLADDSTRITVRAPWAGTGTRDFGFVRFEPGDVFTEHYWRDRWYAIKEVRAADGTLKGWYCDITRPAVRTGTDLTVEDLDLDLWRSADGTAVLRLDEDEFEASGLRQRDPEAAKAATHALDELEELARTEGGLEGLLA
ncbi:ribonuclease FAU-1 family protein [Streptomyces sp. S6]